MLNTVKQNSAARRIHFVCVVALLVLSMGVIFSFSAEPGDPSEVTSGGVVEKLLEAVYPGFTEKDAEERTALVEKYQNTVRETAHFVEFIPLGLFAYFTTALITNDKRKRLALGAAFGILYACSDELHQYFVPERSCQLIDIIIDSSGAFFGCIIGTAAGKISEHMRKQRNQKI